MPSGVFAEWLNANSVRSYPISEKGSKTDITGTFVIPNDFLVSAQINFPRSYVEGSFFVSKVGAFDDHAFITIGYVDSLGNYSDISDVKIDFTTHTKYKNYHFFGSGEHYSVLGIICVDIVDSLIEAGMGIYEFTSDATQFESNCLFISIPAVRRVEVYSGSHLIHIADDVLRLRAGQNIRLSYVNDGTEAIRIDAIAGENLIKPEECDTVPYLKPPCIKTINGIGPDETGDFRITGSDCIRIDPETNGISVHDLCAQACCGCEELGDLTAALEELRAQEQVVRNMIATVSEHQAGMIATLTAQVV